MREDFVELEYAGRFSRIVNKQEQNSSFGFNLFMIGLVLLFFLRCFSYLSAVIIYFIIRNATEEWGSVILARWKSFKDIIIGVFVKIDI